MDDALPVLTAPEARVLGSLIEKQITTPDNYPLSLNSLTNACNQLTNRDPVVVYDEQTVVRAMDGLREKRLGTLFHGADSRVAKYRHAITDAIPLTPAEVAVVCVLLLRGPQTPGELRSRTERLFTFDNLPEVEATLHDLAARTPPLVMRLPRQPGTKESRYAHLLSGPPEPTAPAAAPAPHSAAPVLSTNVAGTGAPSELERIVKLEAEVSDLRQQIITLAQQLADFRKQFE